jgi:drug/metabolite transporter (DMT)-like permease
MADSFVKTELTAGLPAASTSSGGLSTHVRLIAAFAAVYIIWGSTYLAMRFAIETLPPFLMASTRFLVAGSGVYMWMRLRGAPRPTWRQWVATSIVGALLLFAGNGGVVWSEQRVTSSIVALLIAMTPVWMALLDWLRPGGVRPSRGGIAGLGLGLVGIALLVGPGNLVNGAPIDLVGAGVVLLAALAWAAGSIYARHARLPAIPLLASGMEMLAGGVLLMALATATGDWSRVHVDAISLRSALALGYLIVFGSLVAFSAYGWLLKHTTSARVATYAYVNPVIAVFLGWTLAGEPLTVQTLISAAIIVAAIAIIITYRQRESTNTGE